MFFVISNEKNYKTAEKKTIFLIKKREINIKKEKKTRKSFLIRKNEIKQQWS